MKTFKEFMDVCESKVRKSATRSALLGMSNSLPSSGTPSGKKFVPGSGESYGIGGIKLAT